MGKGRVENSIRNVFFSLLNLVVTLLLNFVSRTIFIYTLGSEFLGINGLFTEILMMLSLADLGLGSAMVYSFYKPLAEKDDKKIISLMNVYKKIYIYIALAVTIIGISLIPFLNYIIKLDRPIENLKIYYILFVLNSVASYLFIYKSSMLNADQKGYVISKFSMIFNSIRIVVQAIFLLITHNYILYLIIQILFTLINNIFVGYKVDKLYPHLKGNYKLDKDETKGIFDNVKSVFIYKLSGVLLNGTDNTLISLLVGTVYVGYYSNYNMIIGSISRFINTIFTALTASIGNLITEKNNEKKFSVFKIIQVGSFIIGGISTICLFLMMDDFISLWIGKKFIFDKFTLIAILSNFYLASVLPPIWIYREAAGIFRKTKYLMLVTAIVNLVLSVILGKIYGIGGIIAASLIARLVTYFWYEPVLLYKMYFNSNVKKYFISHLLNVILLLGTIFVVDKASQFILVLGWSTFIIKAGLVLILTTIIYFIVYSTTKEFKHLVGLCKNIILRK